MCALDHDGMLCSLVENGATRCRRSLPVPRRRRLAQTAHASPACRPPPTSSARWSRSCTVPERALRVATVPRAPGRPALALCDVAAGNLRRLVRRHRRHPTTAGTISGRCSCARRPARRSSARAPGARWSRRRCCRAAARSWRRAPCTPSTCSELRWTDDRLPRHKAPDDLGLRSRRHVARRAALEAAAAGSVPIDACRFGSPTNVREKAPGDHRERRRSRQRSARCASVLDRRRRPITRRSSARRSGGQAPLTSAGSWTRSTAPRTSCTGSRSSACRSVSSAYRGVPIVRGSSARAIAGRRLLRHASVVVPFPQRGQRMSVARRDVERSICATGFPFPVQAGPPRRLLPAGARSRATRVRGPPAVPAPPASTCAAPRQGGGVRQLLRIRSRYVGRRRQSGLLVAGGRQGWSRAGTATRLARGSRTGDIVAAPPHVHEAILRVMRGLTRRRSTRGEAVTSVKSGTAGTDAPGAGGPRRTPGAEDERDLLEQTMPGWRRDPSGRYEWRWWDGNGWTNRVANAAPTPPVPRRSRRWSRRPRARHSPRHRSRPLLLCRPCRSFAGRTRCSASAVPFAPVAPGCAPPFAPWRSRRAPCRPTPPLTTARRGASGTARSCPGACRPADAPAVRPPVVWRAPPRRSRASSRKLLGAGRVIATLRGAGADVPPHPKQHEGSLHSQATEAPRRARDARPAIGVAVGAYLPWLTYRIDDIARSRTGDDMGVAAGFVLAAAAFSIAALLGARHRVIGWATMAMSVVIAAMVAMRLLGRARPRWPQLNSGTDGQREHQRRTVDHARRRRHRPRRGVPPRHAGGAPGLTPASLPGAAARICAHLGRRTSPGNPGLGALVAAGRHLHPERPIGPTRLGVGRRPGAARVREDLCPGRSAVTPAASSCTGADHERLRTVPVAASRVTARTLAGTSGPVVAVTSPMSPRNDSPRGSTFTVTAAGSARRRRAAAVPRRGTLPLRPPTSPRRPPRPRRAAPPPGG